jgi:hypothetical protein
MERELKKAFGKQLRKELRVSDELPDAIVKALEVLASKHGHNDNRPAATSDRNGVVGTTATLACKGD